MPAEKSYNPLAYQHGKHFQHSLKQAWLVIHKHLLTAHGKRTESFPFPSGAAFFFFFFTSFLPWQLTFLHVSFLNYKKKGLKRGLQYKYLSSLNTSEQRVALVTKIAKSPRLVLDKAEQHNPDTTKLICKILTDFHRDKETRWANAARSEPYILVVPNEQLQSLQKHIETQVARISYFSSSNVHTHTGSGVVFFFFLPQKQQQLLVNGKQEHNTASIQTVPDFYKHSATAVFKYLKDLYKA